MFSTTGDALLDVADQNEQQLTFEERCAMETITGKHAVWPILHTFYNVESGEEVSIVMETPNTARLNLEACGLYRLLYICSVDAENEYVYFF
jgi:hypothetical protein